MGCDMKQMIRLDVFYVLHIKNPNTNRELCSSYVVAIPPTIVRGATTNSDVSQLKRILHPS